MTLGLFEDIITRYTDLQIQAFQFKAEIVGFVNCEFIGRIGRLTVFFVTPKYLFYDDT